MNNNLESMLEEYQDTILKLRNIYTKIEQKLKEEEGFSQEDADIFLDKKFKEINKNANLKQQQQQKQEQVQVQHQNKNNITNKSTSSNNNNFPLHFQHFQ